jgi:hypothetical protein
MSRGDRHEPIEPAHALARAEKTGKPGVYGQIGGSERRQEIAWLKEGSSGQPTSGRVPAAAPAAVAVEEADCRELLLVPCDQLGPDQRSIRELLDACRDDPARFQDEVLGRRLWSKQVAVCHALAQSPITVVPAGRAVGKSYLLAGIVLWWLYTRPGSLVITTGPDFRQVVSVLWKEIRRALRPRFEQGKRISPRLNLGYDHLTRGYSSPQRLTVQQGTDWGALG